jgi:Squalene-hopene cyclase C-terminal domain
VADRARGKLLLRTALATLLLTLAGAVASAAMAGTSNPRRQKSIDSTVRFLQESQRPSGGFAKPGTKPSQSIGAWVTLALAAAGINPQDQAACGVDAYAFLEGHFAAAIEEEIARPQVATTAFERELLVVDAAGTNPHDFAGYDLVAEIVARQLPDGSLPYVPKGEGQVNDAVFAILALSPVAEPKAQGAVQKAADWLLSEQNLDGGWNWQNRGQESEVDLTGAAIEALNAAGRHDTDAQERAIAFLHRSQRPEGGFAEFPGKEAEANVASTAWGVQGLWAAGENPETWRTGSAEASEEPLDYMESLQQPDGHVRWRRSSDLNGIWMTAYVTPAFAGQALPVPAVPRSIPHASHLSAAGAVELPPSCRESLPAGETAPPGAESPQPGEGVIAGGGGNGAADFSRPQPQSKGRTPGGARIVHSKNLQPGNHSRTRRGENTEQPAGTESSEATDAGAGDEEPSVVSSATVSAAGDGPGGSDGGGVPAPLAKAAPSAPGQRGREVTGTLIGSPAADREGKLAFGAPGLRSAGGGGSGETWIAIALGAGALLAALGGSQWERRREEALP